MIYVIYVPIYRAGADRKDSAKALVMTYGPSAQGSPSLSARLILGNRATRSRGKRVLLLALAEFLAPSPHLSAVTDREPRAFPFRLELTQQTGMKRVVQLIYLNLPSDITRGILIIYFKLRFIF